MNGQSYEFNPCSIDGSDQEEKKITLDNWKITAHHLKLVSSKWRQDSIGTDFNQQPGIDEIRKIQMYLKKKAPDFDIMKAFGITADTLIAIKKDKYDPVEGISLDNQSKIYREFRNIELKIESFLRGLNYIAEIMFINKKEKELFKKSFKKPKKVKEVKKSKCHDSDEINETNFVHHEEEE